MIALTTGAAITTAAIAGRPPAGTRAGATLDSIQLSTWVMGRRTGRHQIAAGVHIRCDLAACQVVEGCGLL